MLEVDIVDQSNDYAVLRAPGAADKFGGPYALVPRAELKETTEAFNKSHTQVGIWALEAERVASGRARLLPGVLGNPDSLKEESHSISGNNDEQLVEYPNYTKPAIWRGLEVPPVLLSGNHGEIAKWRKAEAERRTRQLNQE